VGVGGRGFAPGTRGNRTGEVIERLRTWTRWLENAPLALSLLAIFIAAAVSVLMAKAAGVDAVQAVLGRFEPGWLALLLATRALSYGGYTAAHRATLTPGREEKVSTDAAFKTVAFGAAATSLEGGFSIDHRAMRGAGATPRQATIRVLNLGALELATLAPAACICALTLLGSARVQQAVSVPWAVGVPVGVALVLFVAPHLSPRSLIRKGLLARALARALEALELLVEQLRHPLRYRAAWAGMSVYWAAEILSLWAALRMFGLRPSAAVVVLAYATGHVLTPRSLPLSGVGVTELLLPLALTWTGLPLAGAVPAVFAYRLALLALSIPPAIAAREDVRRLVDVPAARRVAS